MSDYNKIDKHEKNLSARAERKAEIFEYIHNLFIEGVIRQNIARQVAETFGLTKRPSYRWISLYLADPEYMNKRSEVSTYIKNTLMAMYESNFAKGYYRAAMEVLDRLLLVCPWIKDEQEQAKFAPIKVEIVEHKPDKS